MILLSKNEFEQGLRFLLPDYAWEHFGPAIQDEPGAGFSLLVAAPERFRGVLAAYFWLHARDTEAFREVLSGAWGHNHREVIAAAGTRRNLEAMFRAAHFDLPLDWPKRVTLYRGTSALPFETAKRGYSWTTSKHVASFFAMRFAGTNGTPLVLRATVSRDSILHYSNDRTEEEAVCFHVRGAEIDGDANEWHQLMCQFKEENKRRMTAFIAEAMSRNNPEIAETS